MIRRRFRGYPLILVALFAGTACSSSAPAGRVPEPKSGVDRARELLERGELREAREILKSDLEAHPDVREAKELLLRIERLAGVRPLEPEADSVERIILFEVLLHLSAGEDLSERKRFPEAAWQLECALSEIKRHSLEGKFPRAFTEKAQEMLQRARAGTR
jgi:hypothetical protein